MGERPATRTLTEADRSLIADVADLGYRVTATQLKRWRAAGLLPTPSRRARGRGRGRTSDAYSTGTSERVVLIAELVAHKTPLREVPLHLFIRGFHVEEDGLLGAYRELLDWIRSWIFADEDPEDAADRVAQHLRRHSKRHPFGRAWIVRTGTYGARRSSTVEDAWVAVITLFLAEGSPSAEAINALGIVTGETEPEELSAAIAHRSLNTLQEALNTFSGKDLHKARTLFDRTKSDGQRMQQVQEHSGSFELASGLADGETLGELGDILGVLLIAHKVRSDPGYEAALIDIEEALDYAEHKVAEATREVARDSSTSRP